MSDQISSALNIMRRMPPNNIEDNLSGLLNLVPEHTDELLQRVDQPLEAAVCPTSGRKYLLCDYNRDGDSYRSVLVMDFRSFYHCFTFHCVFSVPHGQINTTRLSRTVMALCRLTL